MASKNTKQVPRYLEIMDVLIERIRSGAFSFNEPLCTEASLTEEFSVSRITARHALDELKERGLITRKRGSGCFVIRSAYEHLNKALPIPEVCTNPHTGLFPFIFPGTSDHAQIQTTLQSADEILAAQNGYAAAYLSSDEDSPGCLLSRFADMDIAGVGLMSNAPYAVHSELTHLLLQQKTVLLLGCTSPYPHISSVAFDELSAAELLISHLFALGHRRIAYFSNAVDAVHSIPAQRLSGILLGFSKFDLTISTESLCFSGDPQALRHCLAAGVTAIIAETPLIAQRLARDCTAIGIRIPTSMSLCCFEPCTPIPALRRGAKPISVVCIRRDPSALGTAAAKLLLQGASAPIQPAQSVRLPVQFCTGTSAAAPNSMH